MSGFTIKNMSRINTCELIKPIAVATGAILAWKYLPGMTEDLWYHALLFLDRYRTKPKKSNNNKNEIEDLYEFVDPTGILEKHKQILFQPYTENKVDMKIIYYELIKMLIDYERKNNPSAYDATKQVGKIEGYQELTNKLQRFLNQRFILDIQRLTKSQEEVPCDISEKLKTMNEEIANMKKEQIKLQEVNKNLVSDINKIKERENKMTKKLEHFESVELSLDEINRKTVERLENIEVDGRKLDDKLSAIENKQGFEITEISEKACKNAEDIKNIFKTNEQISNKLDENEKRMQTSYDTTKNLIINNKTTISNLSESHCTHVSRTEKIENNLTKLATDSTCNSEVLKNNEKIIKETNEKVLILDKVIFENDITRMSTKMIELEDIMQRNEARLQQMNELRQSITLIEENRQQSASISKHEADEARLEALDLIKKIDDKVTKSMNTFHTELTNHASIVNEQCRSLQINVTDSLKTNERKLQTAGEHVENLRQLNRQVIDQLKHKLVSQHETLQAGLKSDLQKCSNEIRQEISEKLLSIDIKTSSNEESIKDLFNKSEVLSNQVAAMVSNEEKIKDIVNTIESNQRLEQNKSSAQSALLKDENSKLKARFTEMEENNKIQEKNVNDRIDCIKESCTKHCTEQDKVVKLTNEKLQAIMETATKLMMGSAALEEKFTVLEKHDIELDKKLLDLESAEHFLQESQKLVVERTNTVEQHFKSIENDVIKNIQDDMIKLDAEFDMKYHKLSERIHQLETKDSKQTAYHDEKFTNLNTQIKKLDVEFSAFDPRLQELNLLLKSTETKVKSNTNYFVTIEPKLKEMLDTFEEKLSTLEKTLQNDICQLSGRSTDSEEQLLTMKNRLSDVKADTEDTKERIKNLRDTIAQQDIRIGELAQDNARETEKILSDHHTETKLLLEKFESEYITLKSMEILQPNVWGRLEDQNISQQRKFSALENRLNVLEKQSAEQRASNERIEVTQTELEEDIRSSQEEFRKQRSVMLNKNDDIRAQLVDLYILFKYSSLVIKSFGPVSEHYSDLLGVYRPVAENIYKQDMGENFIYQCPQTNQWLVGTVSGHPYAWLRCNKTSKLPPVKGWEYRHGLEWFNDTSMTLLPFREVQSLEMMLHDNTSPPI